uniref:Uncharacterized protein n=1 Tax=Trichuris muris TaxID=70415 RepID=A0A5S6QBT4_TRIMR
MTQDAKESNGENVGHQESPNTRMMCIKMIRYAYVCGYLSAKTTTTAYLTSRMKIAANIGKRRCASWYFGAMTAME